MGVRVSGDPRRLACAAWCGICGRGVLGRAGRRSTVCAAEIAGLRALELPGPDPNRRRLNFFIQVPTSPGPAEAHSAWASAGPSCACPRKRALAERKSAALSSSNRTDQTRPGRHPDSSARQTTRPSPCGRLQRSCFRAGIRTDRTRCCAICYVHWQLRSASSLHSARTYPRRLITACRTAGRCQIAQQHCRSAWSSLAEWLGE